MSSSPSFFYGFFFLFDLSSSDFKEDAARDLHRKHYMNNDDSMYQSRVLQPSMKNDRGETRVTDTQHASLAYERPQTSMIMSESF
jgi:hypothetical protein